MRWKRILIIGFAAALLALSLYAVSLAHAGIRKMQTMETDRAALGRREGSLHKMTELHARQFRLEDVLRLEYCPRIIS